MFPDQRTESTASSLAAHLFGFGAAVETDVIESRVVQAVLVLLHLGLHTADAAVAALLAPVAILAPLGASALQRWVTAAPELDVVDGRVVTKQALVRLHSDLEGGQCARGAVHGLGPLTETAESERVSG